MILESNKEYSEHVISREKDKLGLHPDSVLPSYGDLLRYYYPIEKGLKFLKDLNRECEMLEQQISEKSWVRQAEENRVMFEKMRRQIMALSGNQQRLMNVMRREFGIEIAEKRKK